MKFYDKVQIICISGKGWDGAASARREAWVPYGGPNWWNGWQWGSVILKADENLNTLLHLRYQKERQAAPGAPGESTDKYGKAWSDLIITIPVWSIISIVSESDEENEPHTAVYHFTHHNEEFIICQWGRWWAWNMHFKNSMVQFPDFALMGEPGQRKSIFIELQLLADVWLIWMPSVGKSSIINSISNTKAKVSEYHFTTLIPNLWSIKRNDHTWNMIDIPWLVEGASEGKWLGNEFLRHIIKARVFAFVLDITRWDDGITEFGILRHEIITYITMRFIHSHEFWSPINELCFELVNHDDHLILMIKDQNGHTFLQKSLVWIINKIDECSDNEVLQEYKHQLIKHIINVFHGLWFTPSHEFETILDKQIIWYSTILDSLKKPFLQRLYHHLSWVPSFSLKVEWIDRAINNRQPRSIELIWNLDDEQIVELLNELWYQPWLRESASKNEDEQHFNNDDEIHNEEDTQELPLDEILWDKSNEIEQDAVSRPRHVRRVYEHELSRLGHQLPWWKVLAEQWFWKVFKQQWLHKRFKASGVKPRDLVWIIWPYDSSKHIVIEHAY